MEKIESTVKDGEYAKGDDVEIEIVKTVPQPDKKETFVFSVKKIKREIEECDADIIKITARKEELVQILEEHKEEINAYQK